MAKAVIPPVSRLCNGIIRILGMNPGMMTLQGTNTYLLGNGKRFMNFQSEYQSVASENYIIDVIIFFHMCHNFCYRRLLLDTGDEGKLEFIASLQKVLKEEDATIEHIIVTHWHHDHIGGVKDVLKLVGSGTSSIPYFKSLSGLRVVYKNTIFL